MFRSTFQWNRKVYNLITPVWPVRHLVNPPPGLYRHYKGKHYWVYGTVIHADTQECLVLYQSVTNDIKTNERLKFVRSIEAFTSSVVVDGDSIPRFSLEKD